jgi:hypothetical protein
MQGADSPSQCAQVMDHLRSCGFGEPSADFQTACETRPQGAAELLGASCDQLSSENDDMKSDGAWWNLWFVHLGEGERCSFGDFQCAGSDMVCRPEVRQLPPTKCTWTMSKKLCRTKAGSGQGCRNDDSCAGDMSCQSGFPQQWGGFSAGGWNVGWGNNLPYGANQLCFYSYGNNGYGNNGYGNSGYGNYGQPNPQMGTFNVTTCW